VRDPHEDGDDPEHDQREQRPEAHTGKPREVAARGIAGAAEAGDEQRGRAARLPDRLRVRRRVVGDCRRGADSHEDAKAEEEADRELLGALGREVEPDQKREPRHVPDEPAAVRKATPEVATGPERAGRNRNEPHRLPEESARLVSCDCRLNGCIEGAHEPRAYYLRTSNSSSLRSICNDPTFSRRWSSDSVPGIGSIAGERLRSHASATCTRVAPCRSAIPASAAPASPRSGK